MERQRKQKRLWVSLTGAVLISVVGMVLVDQHLGAGLTNLSYDIPFLFGGHSVRDEVVLLTLDFRTERALQAPQGRLAHAALLRGLTQSGAALVFYDALFLTPQIESDAEFAAAIRDHGSVVLGSRFDTLEQTTQEQLDLPTPVLHNAAAGWGLVQVGLSDHGAVVRNLFAGTTNFESAVWVASRLLNAPVSREPAHRLEEERWVNFYGPTGHPFTNGTITFSNALQTLATGSNDFYRGKYIFIGGSPESLRRRAETDIFATPYTRFGKGFCSGLELQATAFLNLVTDDWMMGLPNTKQITIVGIWGLIAGLGLVRLRPWHAAWVALVAMMIITTVSLRLHTYERLWWSWLVPVAVQTPLALVWSIGYQYAFESRKARQLRKAFSAYLSPEMAVEISQSDLDVALGGKEVEATILFTDLEGFSTMAETLPPAAVSRILIAYFNRTTRHILERHGMISKYIGDSVMAIWGAPLANADHAEQAVLAACGIREASQAEIEGRRLRTRIGINTGLTLAGNLGSEFRFDYTAIGATTNLASRLETANQFLGTDILISEATRQRLSDQIRVRRLGRFLVKGIRQPVLIYEVLGTMENCPTAPEWLAPFEQAVDLFAKREWEQAGALFRKALVMRDGKDGPSQFYLAQIETLCSSVTLDDSWDGVLKLGT